MTDLVSGVIERFDSARDPHAAEPMARYMRDQFPFLGIPTPERRRLLRELLDGHRPDPHGVLIAAESLWVLDEREYQYAACDLLAQAAKGLRTTALPRIGALITTKSWWDTVDALAISVVGPIVLADRTTGDPLVDQWIGSDDLWLARTAVLHQNRWKASTDETRLFAFCASRACDTDFFMRKAIGWALREYSKSDPEAVRSFVGHHADTLSSLSRREALKRVGR